MKNILLITDGIIHPPLPGRLILQRVLRHMDGFACKQIRSLEGMPDDVDQFAALVLHFHHKTISERALAKLEGYVQNGGGILAIHAATASFKKTQAYFDILGGRFSSHGKVENFEVHKQTNTIFGGIGDFVVLDELYLHVLDPGIEVHFTAKNEGKEVPVVWTYRYGQGKVCYTGPGHVSRTMQNPFYQAILWRALEWVTA